MENVVSWAQQSRTHDESDMEELNMPTLCIHIIDKVTTVYLYSGWIYQRGLSFV